MTGGREGGREDGELGVLIRNRLVSREISVQTLLCLVQYSLMELCVSSPSPQQIFLKVAEDSGVDAAELSGGQQLLSILLL